MKKILPLFLIVILLGNFLFLQPKEVGAVGEGAIVKIAAGSAGERIIAGMAEKAGVKFGTKTAREKAVEKWNLEMFEKIKYYDEVGKTYEKETLERFQSQIANVKPADLSDVVVGGNANSFSKFAVNSVAFVLGADIIYDIYSSFKTSQDLEEDLEVMNDYERGLRTGEYVIQDFGYRFIIDDSDVNKSSYPNGSKLKLSSPTDNSGTYPKLIGYDITKPLIYYFWRENNSFGYYYHGYNFTNPNGSPKTNKVTLISNYTNITTSYISTKMTPILHGDVDPLPDTVNPLLDPLREPDIQSVSESSPVEIPQNYPEEVEIIIPTEADYPEIVEVPWNDPWNDPVTDPGTDPGDGDGTGNGDPTTPPGNGKKLDLTPLMIALANIKDKFPFSIPWDFERFLKQFNIEPKTPKFEIGEKSFIKLGNISMPIDFDFDVDFSIFDGIAKISRWFLLIVFDIFLIFSLRRMTPD